MSEGSSAADGPRAPWIAGAIALLVCLAGAWRPAWSGDESATVVILRRSGSEFWAVVNRDPALGPYYVLMKPWSLISTDHLWLRLPSAMAAAVAVGLLFAFVRQAAGSRLAVATTAAMLVIPSLTRYGQDARPYMMAMLAVVAAVFAWWRWVESARRRWWIALVAALTLAGLMHAYSLLIVLPLLAASAARESSRRRSVLGVALAAGAAVFLLVPFLVVLNDRAFGHPNPPPVNPRELTLAVARLTVPLLHGPGAAAAAVLLVGLGGIGALLLLTRRPAGRGFDVLVASWLVLPPVLLTLLQGTTGRPGLVPRYWVICLPALAIGIGFALVSLRRRWWAVGILATTALLALPFHVSVRTLDGHQGERWLRIPELLDLPGFTSVPLLIQGYSERGLTANAPDLPDASTPLNGDPGPSGRISPIPYGAGTPPFDAMVAQNDVVLIYQQSVPPRTSAPSAKDFTQADDAREVYSEPLVLCQWFGDSVGLFGQSADALGSEQRSGAARLMQSVQPEQIQCVAAAP